MRAWTRHRPRCLFDWRTRALHVQWSSPRSALPGEREIVDSVTASVVGGQVDDDGPWRSWWHPFPIGE